MRARRCSAFPSAATGDEDDDWFFTFFQPYRYVINRVPVYPSIGNHDAAESEECDDRAQVEDNFYLVERLSGEEAAGRASFKPGLFYRTPLRIGHRVRVHRHLQGGILRAPPAVRVPEALGFSRGIVPAGRR